MANTKRVYDPVLTIFKDVSGEKGLENLINCGFIADDIGNILVIVEDSGRLAIRIGAVLACISLSNWLMLFFGLIYILRTASGNTSEGGN